MIKSDPGCLFSPTQCPCTEAVSATGERSDRERQKTRLLVVMLGLSNPELPPLPANHSDRFRTSLGPSAPEGSSESPCHIHTPGRCPLPGGRHASKGFGLDMEDTGTAGKLKRPEQLQDIANNKKVVQTSRPASSVGVGNPGPPQHPSLDPWLVGTLDQLRIPGIYPRPTVNLKGERDEVTQVSVCHPIVCRGAYGSLSCRLCWTLQMVLLPGHSCLFV